jgi:hypothetical protein
MLVKKHLYQINIDIELKIKKNPKTQHMYMLALALSSPSLSLLPSGACTGLGPGWSQARGAAKST